MKKTFLIFGVCAAMFACTESPKEGETTNSEQHSHDGEMHEHEAPAEGAMSMEERTMVPAGAQVFFANIENGATLQSPVHIEMGVEGMEVEPAGAANEGFGHHHLIINNTQGYIERGEVVPMNETNIHFGKGQVEYDIELQPGEYALTLQFANGFHESHGEQMSNTIFITVE
jgi:hypothetical protein